MTLLEMYLNKLYRVEGEGVKLSQLLDAIDETIQTRDEAFEELKKILKYLDSHMQGRDISGD